MVRLKANVRVELNGRLVAEGHNLVVSAGKNLLASIIGASGTKPSHMAMGNSGAATSAGQTALQGTEHLRVALDSTSVNENIISYVATFSTLSTTVSVREFGIFNAAAGGSLLVRFICNAFNMGSGDSLAVSWSVTVG